MRMIFLVSFLSSWIEDESREPERDLERRGLAPKAIFWKAPVERGLESELERDLGRCRLVPKATFSPEVVERDPDRDFERC